MPLLSALAGLAAAAFSWLSVAIHRAFHSNGWDLGVVSQVLWNTAEGRWFEYSFRQISFLGDHWQPALLAFVPIYALGGTELLLVSQAVLLAAAALPLAATQSTAFARLGIAAAWLTGLAVAQSVSFDFHVEAMTPLLAFGAVAAAFKGSRTWFATLMVATLTTKEDAAFLAIGLCWIARWELGWRRLPVALAAVSVAYFLVVTSLVMPAFRGDELSPFVERYRYLGDSPLEALLNAIKDPGLVTGRLAGADALRTWAILLGTAGFLPLLKPRLLPAVALVTVPAMLSDQDTQAGLEFHYLLVPSTVALLIAALVLRENRFRVRLAGVLVASTGVLWAWRSPLPPSFAADMERVQVDAHERAAARMVALVPGDVRVSAQSTLVPHLAERQHIFQFPRVLDAEYVLIDDYGPKPVDDLDEGYDACVAALPRLGFDLVRAEDGLALWRKVREAEYVADVPVWCSGQRP